MLGRKQKILAALLAVGFVAACSGSNGSGTAQSPGADGEVHLTFAEATAPDTLDTQATPITRSRHAWVLAYECLMKLGADGTPQPNLAGEVEESDDGLTYTFTLRDDVKFHNGDDLTSEDVKFTYERQMSEGVPYVQERIPTLKTVETPSDDTVVFRLSEPDPGFLLNTADPLVAGCAIYSASADPATFGTQMVGTGPFAQTEYVRDTRLEMERFEDYWGEPAVASRLTVLYMPSESARRSALIAGEVDATFVDAAGASALEGQDGISVEDIQTPEASHIQLNNTIKPFNDLRVRQAISLALDREQIASVAYQGSAVPSFGIPSFLPWAPDPADLAITGPKVDEAKALLAEAGYPDGFSSSFSYIAQYSPGTEAMAQILQTQLAEAGITLTLEPLEQTVWLERSGGTKHDYELSWNQYGFFADPYQYIRPREGRQGPPPAEVQKTIEQVAASTNTDEYLDNIVEYNRAMNEYVWPTIPVASLMAHLAYREDLINVEVEPSLSRVFLAQVGRS